MAVITDIIDGAEASASRDSVEYTRIFIVSGLTSAGYDMLREAMETYGIPTYGEPHPSVMDAFCYELDAEPVSHNSVKVKARYRQIAFDQNYEVNISSDAEEVESYWAFKSDNDYTDTLYPNTISYKFPANYPNPDYAGQESAPQKIKDIIYRAKPVFRLSRYEWTSLPADMLYGFPARAPLAYLNAAVLFTRRIAYFVGTISLNSWRLFPNNEAYWLCTNISAQMQIDDADRKVYKVNYEFKFNPDTWHRFIAYTDPNTGQIPDDVSTTPYEGQKVSAKIIRPARYADFNLLELDAAPF